MNPLPLENRAIPGVTFKGLMWAAGSLASFAIFIVITYFSILGKLTYSQRTIDNVQNDLKEMKEDRKSSDNSMNTKINKLENQFYDMQIRQVRYELILKEKGFTAID